MMCNNAKFNKKKYFSKVLQRKTIRPTQMIVNSNYLPLHRDQLIQLHLDIPMSKSIDHLSIWSSRPND